MTNLIETPVYEAGIFQLETTTPVIGGQPAIVSGSPVAGHSNAQALQLANRTGYLKGKFDDLPSASTGTIIGVIKPSGSSGTLQQAIVEINDGLQSTGVTYESFSNLQSAINFATTNNRTLKLKSGTYTVPPEGLTISCKIEHEGIVIYDASALASTVDAMTFYASNSIVSQIGLFGRFTINMAGAGRDAIRLRKFEGAHIGFCLVINAGRAGLNVEPIDDYDWMENLTVDYLKVTGCENFIRTYLPNKFAVFANLFQFRHFEGRTCRGYPIHAIFDATTTQGQSIAEWSFDVAEFDTQQRTTDPAPVDYMFYAEYLNGATQGKTQSWVFNILVQENTAVTNAKIHTAGFHCSGAINLWNALVVNRCDRYQVNAGISTVVRDDGRVSYAESGRIDTSVSGDFSVIETGGKRTDRIVITKSLQLNAGSTLDMTTVPLTSVNVQRLVTQYGGGDSFFSVGETKNVYLRGTDVGVTSVYEVHTVYVISSLAEANVSAEFRIICAAGNIEVQTVHAGGFSIAVTATYVTITNTTGLGKTVRLSRTKMV